MYARNLTITPPYFNVISHSQSAVSRKMTDLHFAKTSLILPCKVSVQKSELKNQIWKT